MLRMNQWCRDERFLTRAVAPITAMVALVMTPSIGEAQGLIASAAGREAIRLAVAQERLAIDTGWAQVRTLRTGIPAAQTGRSDDWGAVRRLKQGPRVRVTTRQGQELIGNVTIASEDTVQMVVSGGGKETLLRTDVSAVRLVHRRSVGEYVGVGLLLGAVSGLAIGRASDCDDCELRGLGTVLGGIYGTAGGAIGGWMVGSALRERPERVVYARIK